jgi:hypothetical protein
MRYIHSWMRSPLYTEALTSEDLEGDGKRPKSAHVAGFVLFNYPRGIRINPHTNTAAEHAVSARDFGPRGRS